jgi:hypothetical protein
VLSALLDQAHIFAHHSFTRRPTSAADSFVSRLLTIVRFWLKQAATG